MLFLNSLLMNIISFVCGFLGIAFGIAFIAGLLHHEPADNTLVNVLQITSMILGEIVCVGIIIAAILLPQIGEFMIAKAILLG